jgi:hypothetical protein
VPATGDPRLAAGNGTPAPDRAGTGRLWSQPLELSRCRWPAPGLHRARWLDVRQPRRARSRRHRPQVPAHRLGQQDGTGRRRGPGVDLPDPVSRARRGRRCAWLWRAAIRRGLLRSLPAARGGGNIRQHDRNQGLVSPVRRGRRAAGRDHAPQYCPRRRESGTAAHSGRRRQADAGRAFRTPLRHRRRLRRSAGPRPGGCAGRSGGGAGGCRDCARGLWRGRGRGWQGRSGSDRGPARCPPPRPAQPGCARQGPGLAQRHVAHRHKSRPLYPGVVQHGPIAVAEASGAPLAVAPGNWLDGCPVLDRLLDERAGDLVLRAHLDPSTGRILFADVVFADEGPNIEISPRRWASAKG